jgi:hypothetical protein
MGRELIPFKSRSDAQEFRKDHKGKAVLGFNEITYAAVKGLGRIVCRKNTYKRKIIYPTKKKEVSRLQLLIFQYKIYT